MSGAEIGIAVIGAVAALITAYRDAGSIVENIKERRKARGALPPSVALERSLQEGHHEIEKITAQGVQRFGSDFEQGDDIAHRALQGLTIEVQASFLHHLTLASKDDNVTDFEACIDSAIEARLRAVTILNELYLRQQKRSSLQSEPEVVVSPSSPPTGPKKRSGTLTPELDAGTPLSPTRSRKSSWNPFKSVRRTTSTEQTNQTPWAKEGSSATSGARNTSPNIVTSPTLSPRPVMSSSPGSLNDFRRSIMTPPMSRASTNSSIDALAAAAFCKGAYYIQQGVYEKGLQVSLKNMEWSCHCRKCPFATPADRDERGRPRFDDTVHEAAKMRFRPLLLFKSHLSSSQKKLRVYKCLICVLLGDTSSTYEGERHLLEHMSRHAGERLDGAELYGPICLEPSGTRMGSERTFDICFPDNPRWSLPPSAIELDGTREIVEADGMEITDNEVFKNQWEDEVRR